MVQPLEVKNKKKSCAPSKVCLWIATAISDVDAPSNLVKALSPDRCWPGRCWQMVSPDPSACLFLLQTPTAAPALHSLTFSHSLSLFIYMYMPFLLAICLVVMYCCTAAWVLLWSNRVHSALTTTVMWIIWRWISNKLSYHVIMYSFNLYPQSRAKRRM